MIATNVLNVQKIPIATSLRSRVLTAARQPIPAIYVSRAPQIPIATLNQNTAVTVVLPITVVRNAWLVKKNLPVHTV